MLSILLGPRIPISVLQANFSGDTPTNNLPFDPYLLPPQKDTMSGTRSLSPNSSFPVVTTSSQAKVLPGKTKTKALNNIIPSPRKGVVEEEIINTNRTTLGGGAFSLPVMLDRAFSTVPRNSPENLSRNFNSLHRRGSVTSSSTSGFTQQQQAFRPSLSCEALGLSGHRTSDGHLVTGLLQSSLSGSQTRQILQAHHRPQEVKSLPGHSFFQDGNSFLHHSSSTTTRMDYQDRYQRCLSSYPRSCEHSQVLSLCYSWKDLPVRCSPIWTLNVALRVHQNISTNGSAAPYSGNQSSCLPRSSGQIHQKRVSNILNRPSNSCSL